MPASRAGGPRRATGRADQQTPPGPNRNERVWAVVHRIPRGRVATYKQVAQHAALPGPTGARQVGYALAALAEGSRIPWHRVVNAAGRVSPRESSALQRELLEAEGVCFDLDGVVDLERYGWRR
jgi:methylated-DNA-protein-cysteine methyltransferase-like protein